MVSAYRMKESTYGCTTEIAALGSVQPSQINEIYFKVQKYISSTIIWEGVGMTAEEKEEIQKILKPYLQDKRIQKMKKYIQHGNVTTYEHCLRVVKESYHLNKKYHLGADLKILLVGALLHDFYLYDWHEKDHNLHRLHGFHHPERAKKNAVRHFHVPEEVADIIDTHMWPLTFFHFPSSKEGWILSLADKRVSLKESLLCR